MNLTSLRKSYSKLLGSFKEAGVVLNESQQENLDSFMLMLEKKMTENREEAIRSTKKVVVEHMEQEYKKVFDSLIESMKKNNELQNKIQIAEAVKTESKKIAEAVDNYLDLYMDKVLPQKTIVDYDRMMKLEKIQESLKNTLMMNENSEKKEIKDKNLCLEKKVKNLENQLSEEQKKVEEAVFQKEQLNAKEILESKIQNLPEAEAEIVKESLKNASTSEIKMKFESVLKQARAKVLEESTPEEKVLQTKEEPNKPDDNEVKVQPAKVEVRKIVQAVNDPDTTPIEEAIEGILTEKRGSKVQKKFDNMETTKPPEEKCVDESIDEDVMIDWIRMAKGL